uniref:glucose-6-phosphate 1-epimerase n=1 Tax=mine drainage metagenome TaxID=410659 RepID=E6QTD9_9ZZZZ
MKMHKMDLVALNEEFGMISTLKIEDISGVPVLIISTPLANARIALQGAQVLAWQPAGHMPILWTSHHAVYRPGQGVRGGVPVCWPWFGAGEEGQPAHGFVRTRMWTLRETNWVGDRLIVRMGLSDNADTRAIWDHGFDLELQVDIGRTLVMRLVTRNTGHKTFHITDALHTYFFVGDIARTTVTGLEKTAYLDKVLDFKQHVQTGPVTFTGETDRIYLDTTSTCVIHDPAQDRKIVVSKSGSHSTVVWNPWLDKAAKFADMRPEEYQHMLCVETANAGKDSIALAHGEQHVLETEISVEVTA